MAVTIEIEAVKLVGVCIDRVGGPLKVTAAARYLSDFSFPNLALASLCVARSPPE
jgi:CO/xanthine dehydrogenase Mo-binding subunit